MRRAIGAVINEIVMEKNLRISDLAKLTGKSRQNIYFTFGRSKMSDNEIEEWAKILDVPKEDILNRVNGEQLNPSSDNLMEQIKSIEQMFKEQLVAKDKQIESLTKMLDNLLGKSEGVSFEPNKSKKAIICDLFGHTQLATAAI